MPSLGALLLFSWLGLSNFNMTVFVLSYYTLFCCLSEVFWGVLMVWLIFLMRDGKKVDQDREKVRRNWEERNEKKMYSDDIV